MNHISQRLRVGKAIEGFLQAKAAEALSPRTIDIYRSILGQWYVYVGDVPVHKLAAQDIRAYLAYLRTTYVPKRLSRKTQPLAPKTIRNVYICLASLFSWLNREFALPSPVKSVVPPAFVAAEVEPFSQAEVEALLKAAEYCQQAKTEGRRSFAMRRRTAPRDRAIILVLLDTGLRASELCALQIRDVEEKTGKVTVKHGYGGGAKGGKGRTVYLGKSARKALWHYLITREDGEDHEAPLFLANHRQLGRDSLRQLMQRLGDKAEIENCHAHRLRHTFAITYLRSGGDVFTLQSLLGHSTLEMVQHYARLAQIDVEQAHRRASPADNWRL
jgi:integrase/recombinase XerD